MSARARLILDGVLLAAFVAADDPVATGIAFHEWLCLALVAVALFHMALSWDWVVRTAVSFLATLRATSRVNLVVDAVLFVATVTVMLSGFMVSRTLSGMAGWVPATAVLWHQAHSVSADVTMYALVVHAILHWRWIANVVTGGALRRPPAVDGRQATCVPRTVVPPRSSASRALSIREGSDSCVEP